MYVRAFLLPVAKLSVVATLALSTAGCGVFSALGNPKAAFALQEPAPMAVILRRADAARATATNIDRLMGATAVDEKSKWIEKLALKKADVETQLKDIGNDPDYVVPPKAKIRVIQAEAWAVTLSSLCPHESKFPSLMATVSPDVATAYTEVAAQSKTIAKLKGDKELEEKALDEKDISAADKETHEKKKKEIEEQIEKTDAEYKPKVEAFLTKLKSDAGKATPEAKKQLAVALVGFKRAIEDAKMANSVALIRYPLAMPGMPQELKTQAKRIVADVIEDRTGHRPTLEKFDPDIKLDGGVKLTLNGLPPEAIGGLKPDALLGDVTSRAKDYAAKVLTLTAYIAETQEMLDLQTTIIKTTMEGMDTDEAKVEGVGEDLSEVKVELDAVAVATAGAGAVTAKGKPGGGKSSRHPVPIAACDAGGGKKTASVDDDGGSGGAAGGGGKGGGGKGGKGGGKGGAPASKAAPVAKAAPAAKPEKKKK